jgi:hypothetical protein
MKLEISAEEPDLLSRSKKKVKVDNGKRRLVEETSPDSLAAGRETKGNLSYKDSLVGDSHTDQRMTCDNEYDEYVSDDDDDDDCPLIQLSAEGKRRIREPWRQTLIVKLMGRRTGYSYLMKKLQML